MEVGVANKVQRKTQFPRHLLWGDRGNFQCSGGRWWWGGGGTGEHSVSLLTNPPPPVQMSVFYRALGWCSVFCFGGGYLGGGWRDTVCLGAWLGVRHSPSSSTPSPVTPPLFAWWPVGAVPPLSSPMRQGVIMPIAGPALALLPGFPNVTEVELAAFSLVAFLATDPGHQGVLGPLVEPHVQRYLAGAEHDADVWVWEATALRVCGLHACVAGLHACVAALCACVARYVFGYAACVCGCTACV